MARKVKVAAAQIGRIDTDTPGHVVIGRMNNLLDQAHARNVQLVTFPEATFSTFFCRFLLSDEKLHQYFQKEDKDPSIGITQCAVVKDFFTHAKKLGIDVCVGYGEETPNGDRYNTSIYVRGDTGSVISKYRKVHLPGTVEPFDDPEATNQFEKRYFKPGDLGFPAFRAPSLKMKSDNSAVSPVCGVEIVMIGYNTPGFAYKLMNVPKDTPEDKAREESIFHHKLTMQCHSYTNSTYSIAAARCGWDDGKYELIANSIIVDPIGRIIAEAKTTEDELVVADIDLDLCQSGKERMFNFALHRRTEHYGRIVNQTGAISPEE